MEPNRITSRDDGRELIVHVQLDGTDYRLVLPREMLDDECGDDASEDTRRDWTRDNLAGVMSAIASRDGGGWIKAPFDSILVEEIT